MSGMYYGKRLRSGGRRSYRKKSRLGALTVKNKLYVPGKNRTSGFYGRFSGPGGETKFFDTALAFTYDATGEVPATGQLNLIPQGVTESTRIGRKCVIKSIQLRGVQYFSPGASAVAATVTYLYLVQDTQCNGAAAAITDVITSNDMANGMINMANSSRFKILKRWVIPFNSAAGVSAAFNNIIKPLEFYKKCNIPLEFSSTTGAITEIRSNNIFLLAGTGGGSSDDVVTMDGTCRVKFSDS